MVEKRISEEKGKSFSLQCYAMLWCCGSVPAALSCSVETIHFQSGNINPCNKYAAYALSVVCLSYGLSSSRTLSRTRRMGFILNITWETNTTTNADLLNIIFNQSSWSRSSSSSSSRSSISNGSPSTKGNNKEGFDHISTPA